MCIAEIIEMYERQRMLTMDQEFYQNKYTQFMEFHSEYNVTIHIIFIRLLHSG